MASHVSGLTYRADWFGGLTCLGQFLPRFLVREISAFIGHVYAATHRSKVEVVRKNLALLGSGREPDPASVYAHFGRVMADYFYLGSRSPSAALGLIEERHGFEYLQAAQRAGRGALLLMPHLSFFELGGVVMRDIGIPMVALTNPEPSPALTEWRAAYRLRWGVETVEVGNDSFQFLEIKKLLEAGKFVGALFDRPHASQSFGAQVPGGTLPCSSGVLLLAILAKCPIIPVTVVVKPNGKYRLEALAPIQVERRGSSSETLEYYTQVLVDALWPTIAAHPEQWFQFAPLQSAS
jgi:KDO2-lipid IV(A) lauroyltransferase